MFGLRLYAISMTVILLIWAGVLFWGARELSNVLRYTGGP
jgi:hypothetical protein